MTVSLVRKAERVSTIPASDVKLDTSAVSVTAVISTEGRDRSEDIVITSGIDIQNHSINPVVLLEHQHPIGVARTPDGIYTVEKHNGFAIGTTYFDQHNPLALETFRLIDDGILKGASIGFVVRRAGIIQADAGRVDIKVDADGDRIPTPKFGLRYDEVELVEYSHTILPDNPEALTVAVQKSRVGGYPMSDPLKRLLAPYALDSKTWVSVPAGVPTETNTVQPQDETPPDNDATSKVETKHLQPETKIVADDYIPPEEMQQQAPAETPDEASKSEDVEAPSPADDLPPGARLLDGLYNRFLEAAQYLEDEGGSKRQENPDVLMFVADMVAQLDEVCSNVAAQYDALYPDLDSLTGAENQSMDESEDAEPAEDEDEPAEPEGKRTRRRLAKRIEHYRKHRLGLKPIEVKTNVVDEATQQKVDQLSKSLDRLQTQYTRLVKQFKAARYGR